MGYGVKREEVVEWLQGFTYKPDWKFDVVNGIFMDDVVMIKVRAMVPDVNSVVDFEDMTLIPPDPFEPWMLKSDHQMPIPIRYSKLGGLIQVPPYIEGRGDFFRWLLNDGLRGLECHETIEWGRVNGKPIFNPHPNAGMSTSHASVTNYMLED